MDFVCLPSYWWHQKDSGNTSVNQLVPTLVLIIGCLPCAPI